MKRALLLIDIQNDYFPGGRMELVGMDASAANARVLLNDFRNTKSTVIHIQHISIRPGATFFLPDTDGAKINQTVTPREDEIVVVKNFPNAFRGTTLLDILKREEVEELVICGAMSHMCIDATTRTSFDLGLSCTVVEDACATKELLFKGKRIKASDIHASFMAALSAPYAKVVSTKEITGNRGGD